MLAVMPRNLDFTTLPGESEFESRSIFMDFPKELESRLSPLPEVLNRLKSAVMFAETSAKNSEPWRAAAHLRASLAEFCSSEEMQKLDKPGARHLRLADVEDPLIHLLELMRHLNIHVKSAETDSIAINVSWGDQEFEMTAYTISNLGYQDLASLRNGKDYLPADLQRMVAWFEKAQRHWGAGHVVRVGTEALANRLCKHYGL